jgi:hypothetical protein
LFLFLLLLSTSTEKVTEMWRRDAPAGSSPLLENGTHMCPGPRGRAYMDAVRRLQITYAVSNKCGDVDRSPSRFHRSRKVARSPLSPPQRGRHPRGNHDRDNHCFGFEFRGLRICCLSWTIYMSVSLGTPSSLLWIRVLLLK